MPLNLYDILDFRAEKCTYAKIPHSYNLSISGDLTIEFWLFLRNWSSDWTDIISKFVNDQNNEFCFRTKNERIGQFYYGDGHKAVPVVHWVPEEDIALNQWTHVACVRKTGDYGKIYFNGKLLRQNDWGGQTEAKKTQSPVILMASLQSGRFQDGKIAGVRLWNIARSQEDIRNFSDKELTGTENGLSGLWRPDSSNNRLLFDFAKNSHGRIYEGAWSEFEKPKDERVNKNLNSLATDAKNSFKSRKKYVLLDDQVSARKSGGSYPKRCCNICGCVHFGDMGSRKNVSCTHCGSLERTRLLYLYLQNFRLINANSKVFHLAPEKGLYKVISKTIHESNYYVADLDPARYPFVNNIKKFDLCNDVDNLPESYFDLIIHSHVFEHIPCNYTYVLYHLHRALRHDGWHLCVIPFMDGYYDEYFGSLRDEEAKRRFGQHDHVRRIGIKDIQNTFGRVIPIDPNYDVTKVFSPDVLLKYNIPEACWKGLTINTVLVLRKYDFIISAGLL